MLKFSQYFQPRLIEALRDYDKARFTSDVTVGTIALPLAIPFAIASGAKPEAGIFTAIIAGFIISALGGSRVQVGGPTGAFIVIVYGIIVQYGCANLLICTMMAGVMLVAMGLVRMCNLIRFFPRPLIMGFTSGIAELNHVSVAAESPQANDGEATLMRKAVPKGVVIYRVFGALFFGAADKLEAILAKTNAEPEVLILKMHEVISMDASALHTLEHLFGKLRKRGKHLILCGPHTQPHFLMQ